LLLIDVSLSCLFFVSSFSLRASSSPPVIHSCPCDRNTRAIPPCFYRFARSLCSGKRIYGVCSPPPCFWLLEAVLLACFFGFLRSAQSRKMGIANTDVLVPPPSPPLAFLYSFHPLTLFPRLTYPVRLTRVLASLPHLRPESYPRRSCGCALFPLRLSAPIAP